MNKIEFAKALYAALRAVDNCSDTSDPVISEACNKAFDEINKAIAHFESHVANIEYDDMGQPTGKYELIE